MPKLVLSKMTLAVSITLMSIAAQSQGITTPRTPSPASGRNANHWNFYGNR